MSENFGSDKKSALEYLKIQNQIADAQERNRKGLSSYIESKKQLLENTKLLKALESEIVDLEKQKYKIGSDEEKQRLNSIADYRKQAEQLRAINKSTTGILQGLRAVGNELKSKLIPSFSSIYEKSQTVDKAIRSTSASMGLGANQMAVLRSNMSDASMVAEGLNVTTEQLVEAQGAYANETGRASLLSGQALRTTVELSRALNMTVGEMSTLTGEMEAFGMGAEKSLEVVRDVRDIAAAQGVNAGKVVKKFQQNLKLLNKLEFKGGVKGMASMAAYSEKYKISMESVASVSEKVFRPEGAIEAAANLQMLGGSLSQLGDPFQLMYQARYAPEELAKSLSKAVSSSAEWNAETQSWDMNALELDRMREAASALGMPFEELVETAKQTAKIDMFGDMLGSMSPKDKELLSGMAEFSEKGVAQIQFMDKDGVTQTRALQDMNSNMVKEMQEAKESNKVLAEQSQTFDESFKGLQNQLKALAAEFLLPFLNIVKPLITSIVDVVSNMPNSLKTLIGALVLGGAALFNAAKWVYSGVQLRKGFDSGSVKEGLGKLNPFKKKVSPETSNPLSNESSKIQTPNKQTPTTPTTPKTPKTPTTPKTPKTPTTPKKGGDTGKSLTNLSKGLTAMGTGKVLFGALNLIPASIGLIAMVPAIPTMMYLSSGNSVFKSLSALGRGLTAMGTPLVSFGALNLLLASVAFIGMTAGLIGLGGIALLGGAAGTGLTLLGQGLVAFGATAGTVGWLGVAVLAALSLAFIGFGYGLKLAGEGIASIIGAFTTMFSVVDGDNLIKIGVGFIAMGVGLGILTLSMLALSVSSLALLPALGILTVLTSLLSGTAVVMEKANFSSSLEGINNLDKDKLSMLKELVTASSTGKPIRVEFSDMNLKGDISLSGEGGGKTSTDWLSDPIFIRELKNLISEKLEDDRT